MKHTEHQNRKSFKSWGLTGQLTGSNPTQVKHRAFPRRYLPALGGGINQVALGQQRGPIQFRPFSIDSHAANRFGKWDNKNTSPRGKQVPRPSRRDVTTTKKYVRIDTGMIVRR